MSKQLDASAIADAVKKEIDRQNMDIDYDSLSKEELERAVKQLQDRLALMQGALSKHGDAPVSAPRSAEKVTGKFPDLPWTKADGTQDADKIIEYMTDQMSNRIMILDGAMGTAIQEYKFTEQDFRMDKFKDHPGEIKGNNDLLVFTQPDTIQEIHRRYYAAGADICETNTFSGTTIAQADYKMEHVVYEMNKVACELCVEAAKEVTAKEPHRPRLVAGAIGPTNRTLSISPSVEDPGYRNCSWDEVVTAYTEQVPLPALDQPCLTRLACPVP